MKLPVMEGLDWSGSDFFSHHMLVSPPSAPMVTPSTHPVSTPCYFLVRVFCHWVPLCFPLVNSPFKSSLCIPFSPAAFWAGQVLYITLCCISSPLAGSSSSSVLSNICSKETLQFFFAVPVPSNSICLLSYLIPTGPRQLATSLSEHTAERRLMEMNEWG